MTITLEINSSAGLGCRPSVNVSVTALSADGEEMPFVSSLVKAVKSFANSFDNAKEEK